ncbi:acetyl-CoA C-acyltransferase [Chromatocurvus halotolerans]|uniref:Acetyl-CoA C-acetyltransferase n=1 Tax=Chromatocurvus halotolerans TaxID=1132028 RepID=A0A4R2KQ33_9GAMM|nr:acetyl-CoA C-acyltransferase [Chromatocurvus halotolerans]TCO72218.1 acetyl-CoA C-acetyltransferase [Chromatocurvus halotolerans]
MKDAFLFDALRSPRGRAKDTGGLHELTPQALLQQLYAALVERTGLDPATVDDVILGCVTQQGEQAGNIAKSSTLYSGWPTWVPGITVNRYCSSGIDAIALAGAKINAGIADTVVAGGVEMMSRVPMLADRARVFSDPEFAVACKMLMMGSGADLIASLHGVSREAADAVALASQQRAARAREAGYFSRSLIPISTAQGTVDQDECIRAAISADDLAGLPPAFAELGAAGTDALQLQGHDHLESISHIHTAGNSPAMADGAALVLVGDNELASRCGVSPRARISASITVSADPLQVLSGCVEAARALMQRQGLSSADVDLFEIHEAFAATSVMCQRTLGIDDDKLNVNGGVIALGHPMGATGAMMAGTLLDELERRDLSCGIVSAAGAAGTGSALFIERL